MTDEQRIAKGRQAAQALDDLGWAFEAVEKSLFEKLSATPITSPDTVLRIHAGIQALEAVRVAIKNVIIDGQMAEHAAQQIAR